MTDKWHWLRHKWTKWEPYQMNYHNYSPDIRQWRVCETCGFLQDEVVNVNAKLQVSPDSHWPKSAKPIMPNSPLAEQRNPR